jgi:hypothetical protein
MTEKRTAGKMRRAIPCWLYSCDRNSWNRNSRLAGRIACLNVERAVLLVQPRGWFSICRPAGGF